jgi:two-component sensor histidine kinase
VSFLGLIFYLIDYFLNKEIKGLSLLYLIDNITSLSIFSTLAIILVGLFQKNLKEKNVLIEEIHHRVKNNLQIILSLLSLKTNRIRGDHNLYLLKDLRNQIFSISKIHTMLYKTPDYSLIDFDIYIKEIANELLSVYQDENKAINIKIDIGHIVLDITKSIPCALIINELITNSLKYAFHLLDKGNIFISMRRVNDFYELNVFDDGVGLPKSVNFFDAHSFGFQLINMLIKQLNGKIETISTHGAGFKIEFEA